MYDDALFLAQVEQIADLARKHKVRISVIVGSQIVAS